jgi:hypothetical protein
MHVIALLAGLLCAWCSAAETAPLWVSDQGRATLFPKEQWLSGDAEATIAEDRDQARCLELVTESCQSVLAHHLRAEVDALTAIEPSLATGSVCARFDRSFADNGHLLGRLTMVNRTLESWFDEDTHRAYAICAIRRLEGGDSLRGKVEAALTELDAATESAHSAEVTRLTEAQVGWSRVLTGLREVSDDLALAHALAATATDGALAQRLSTSHDRAVQALARLAGHTLTSAEDLAYELAVQLGRAGCTPPPLVVVPPLSVDASRFSSPLGRHLAQELASKLSIASNWKVSRASAAGPTRDAAVAAGANAVLLGTTWNRPDGLGCAVSAYRLSDGQLIAAAEATLPTPGLRATGLDSTPSNITQALADQRQFHRAEVPYSDLHLDLWTSKGDDMPVFVNGETVHIYARLDQPAHLRLVYHLADGRRALLLDDLRIEAAQVDQAYQLPNPRVVAAPYGAETIQANASTAPFPTLATRSEDRYLILTDDLATSNATTRSLGKETVGINQAEARVVVLTLEK